MRSAQELRMIAMQAVNRHKNIDDAFAEDFLRIDIWEDFELLDYERQFSSHHVSHIEVTRGTHPLTTHSYMTMKQSRVAIPKDKESEYIWRSSYLRNVRKPWAFYKYSPDVINPATFLLLTKLRIYGR